MTITTLRANQTTQTTRSGHHPPLTQNPAQNNQQDNSDLNPNESLQLSKQPLESKITHELPFSFPNVKPGYRAATPEKALEHLVAQVDSIMAHTSDPKARGGLILSRLSSFDHQLGTINIETRDNLLEQLSAMPSVSPETLGWIQYHIENMEVNQSAPMELLNELIIDVEQALNQTQDPKARGGIILSRLAQFQNELGSVNSNTLQELYHSIIDSETISHEARGWLQPHFARLQTKP